MNESNRSHCSVRQRLHSPSSVPPPRQCLYFRPLSFRCSTKINKFYNDGRQKNFAGGILGPSNNAEYWQQQYY